MKSGDRFKFVRYDYSVVDVTMAEFHEGIGATFYHKDELYFCLHGKLSSEWKHLSKLNKLINTDLIEYISDSIKRHGMILESTWMAIVAKHNGAYTRETREYSQDECAFG